MTQMKNLRRSRRAHFAFASMLAGAVASGVLSLPLAAHADPTQPSASDRQIALAVSMLMERQHLSGHKLDAQMSERCFETFIKDLDPLKLFFYQSDIDEFKARENELGVARSAATSNLLTTYSTVF